MSDGNKAFWSVVGYFLCWVIAIVQYLVIACIINLITIVIPTDSNIWLVSLIILTLFNINKLARIVSKRTIDEMDKVE